MGTDSRAVYLGFQKLLARMPSFASSSSPVMSRRSSPQFVNVPEGGLWASASEIFARRGMRAVAID
eukprot:11795607-Alexandrium_andersonii.AAC.1